MSNTIGFNFRSSSGWTTDPADTTYVLGDAYPTTRAGYTFGWNGGVLTADRTLDDARIAGLNYHAAPSVSFQVDLSAGTYAIHMGIGDGLGGTNLTTVDVYDNASLLFSVAQVSTTANSFTDAQGNEYTAANWPASEQPVTAVLTSPALIFNVRGTSGGIPGVAHFAAVEQVGGGAPVGFPFITVLDAKRIM